MHPHSIGDDTQVQRLEMGHAVAQKAVLLANYFLCHFQDCASALIEAAYQPAGRLHAIGQEGLLLSFYRGADFRIIFIVDDQTRHCFGVEFNRPAIVA